MRILDTTRRAVVKLAKTVVGPAPDSGFICGECERWLPVLSAIVAANAPPSAPALQTITELLQCPIRTLACRRVTCARPKLPR